MTAAWDRSEDKQGTRQLPGRGLAGLLTLERGGKGEGGLQRGAMFPVWTPEQVATFLTENEAMLRHEGDEAASGCAEAIAAAGLPAGMSGRQRGLRQGCHWQAQALLKNLLQLSNRW